MLLISAATWRAARDAGETDAGRRDAHLLNLRDWAFGPQLAAWRFARLRRATGNGIPRGGLACRGEAEPPDTLATERRGVRAAFRAPNSEDLLAVADRQEWRRRGNNCSNDVFRSTRQGAQVAVANCRGSGRRGGDASRRRIPKLTCGSR